MTEFLNMNIVPIGMWKQVEDYTYRGQTSTKDIQIKVHALQHVDKSQTIASAHTVNGNRIDGPPSLVVTRDPLVPVALQDMRTCSPLVLYNTSLTQIFFRKQRQAYRAATLWASPVSAG